jgi:hypothetical protein
MRTFLISLFLFSLIIAISIFNSFYISSVTDDLTDAVLKIRVPRSGEALTGNETKELASLWYKNRPLIALSVNLEYLCMADAAVECMTAYAKTNELPEFEASRQTMLLCIKRIKNLECFNLCNII